MKKETLFIGLVLIATIACGNKHGTASNGDKITETPDREISNFGVVSDSLNKLDLTYSIEQLDNTIGLSNSSVNTIFQDSENLLWIGTWDGLNRYDGSTFKIFRPEINNENSLSNQVILKIDEDNAGQIWVLTMHGINRYDKKANTFRRYYFSRKNSPPLSESEFHMALDASKTVFCSVKGWGIGYYEKDEDDFQRLNSMKLPKAAVKKMEFSKSGDLFVLYENNELFRLSIITNGNGEKIIARSDKISENAHEFVIQQNQKICIVLKSGAVKIPSLLDQSSLEINEKGIQSIIGDTPEGIILASKSELIVIDSLGKSINRPWTKYLNGKKITTLIQGSENVLWVGTDGDGIFKLYPLLKSFNLISKTQVPEFSEGIVRAFSEIKGNSFWVGTKGKGLFRFPSRFYQDLERPLRYQNFNENNSSINNAIFALHHGQDSLIFIGTDGEGIDIFDLKKSKLFNWSEILESDLYQYFRSTYAIYQDKKGFLWLGTNGFGLIRLKIKRSGQGLKVSEFRKYEAGDESGKVLSSNIIFSILPKNEDELWIGTRLGGLNLFNKGSGVFRVYKNIKDDPESLSNNDILCLHSDKEKRLWVGTSFGLNVLQELKENGEAVFKSFTDKEGLPNNTIHGIVSDKRNNLWISTNFGLSRFKTGESRFINFTKNEGLQNNEFADGAFYHDAETDVVFMGGIKGFNYFLPSEIRETTFVPDILIDEISGQRKEPPYYHGIVVSPSSNTHPSIVLNHDQNYFDIELAVLTYINSEKCKYAYQLSGFNDEWVNLENRRNISLTNVPPGDYSLWLKWTNSDGVWTNPVQAMNMKIKPIFWRSNFAVILYSFLVVLFLMFVWSYFNEQYKLRQNILFQKREEEIHQNRLTFFTNIAHEFQTPLTLITGPIQKLSEVVEISEKNQRFIQMIQRNASRLLFLTQQLLEFRKAEFDHLEVVEEQFNLVHLIEQIAELFDELAIQKDIDYRLVTPSLLEGYFDKDKIEKIVFNLLSNAFKYTPKNGKIELQVFTETETTNTLNIVMSNSGKAIPKEKLEHLFTRFFLLDKTENTNRFRTGIGLAYVKRLAAVLEGEITVSSNDALTSFTVILPFNLEAINNKDLDDRGGQVFISSHLKNILEDVSGDSENIPSKVSSLEVFLNKRKVVLIVEDEKDVQVFLNQLLNEKYKVLIANNGVEAIEIIKKEVPDVIVSDVMMPEMDGIELCKKIRSTIDTCHIPLIMLTAKNSIIHRIEGLESGANAYIPKPFHPDHLQVRIQKLLEEKELMLKHLSQDTPIEIVTNRMGNDDEKDFMRKVIELIQNNIANENLQSSYIEKELGMSSSQLYRKIKYICGFSPGDLIRTIRLKHAAELLRKNSLTVSEVCYLSGFNNRSYFYREFKKMYNIAPKNYQLKPKSNLGI
ncbi:hybrid sensor histidine kinase/response regulator transcription factor [Ulvibacterium marinum]|uniref:hybrid sensor histidine kinase/response regulator transcription factor n=1 Tax=Ulvibacterium marinum TaxID=2419782 RepID=UPI0024944214|nr:two-component regulator propeller domain-containing protein [Ulvibacterium marinum]